MPFGAPRTHLRSDNQPQAVHSAGHRSRARPYEKEKHRIKRGEPQRLPKRDVSHRRVSSHAPIQTLPESPRLVLEIIKQPAETVSFESTFGLTVALSAVVTSTATRFSKEATDSSSLFAVVSLVINSPDGGVTQLEARYLMGQKLFDSIHPMTEECLALNPTEQACSVRLGYFDFPGLSIVSPGVYRIRVTLLRLDNHSGGALSVQSKDSNFVRVEGRSVPLLRTKEHA